MRDYEELVKRLREADEKSMCGECGLNLHSGTTKKGVLFAESADAIEELVSNADKFKWISVDERLPEDGVFVLAANDDGKMLVSKYESEVLGWYLKYCCYDFDVWDSEENGPVTYWMPLPEPPKEDKP